MKANTHRYVKQYAVGIIDFSSQYGGENQRSFSYSVSNIIGEPKIFPKYGDFTQAAVMRTYGPWWNKNECLNCDTRPRSIKFQSQDYIDVVFDRAVFPWSIAIYETYNPGAVVRILALCQEFPKQTNPSGTENSSSVDPDICGKAIPVPPYGYTHWEVLWENTSPVVAHTREARMFAPILREIKYRTRIVRLEFVHSHLEYYTELDAVELTGTISPTSSSSVDPPTLAMSSLSLSQIPSTSSSTEELAYLESKVDYKTGINQEMEVETNANIVFAAIDRILGDLETELDVLDNGYFSLLPPEIISKIFSYLPFPDFCRVGAVCQLFKEHSYDPNQLVHLNLQPYWHMINDGTLNSIEVRCGVAGPCNNSPVLRTLNMRWLGGGDLVSPSRLNDFFHNCNFSCLTFLDLASSFSVTDTTLDSITRVAPSLCYLNIESCDKLTTEGIRLLHRLHNLQVLNLYRTKVDDAGIISVIHANPKLRTLNLGSCPCIVDYDRVLQELAQHSKSLTALDTWRAKSLTSQGLNALTSCCKYLEELDLGWCGTLQSNSGCFVNLARNCPNLTKLFVTANRTFCDSEINLLAKHCHKLRQLDILGTRLVSKAAMENLIQNCPNLYFLDVSFCYAFTEEVVESLRQSYPRVTIKRSFQN